MRIENLENLDVAFIRRVGPFGPENHKVMSDLLEWSRANGRLGNGVVFGIARDVSHNPEQSIYDACITVETGFEPDEKVSKGVIAGGSYAVFKTAHTSKAVEQFWQSLFDVLQEEGLVLDESRPVLERYSSEMVKNGMCEFCVPVC